MTSTNIPRWNLSGDWFDVCKYKIPVHALSLKHLVMATAMVYWPINIKSGQYGRISLDGLNVVALADFQGNILCKYKYPNAKLSLEFELLATQKHKDR